MLERIAEVVTEQVKLQHVKFMFTGGFNGGRGWLGDVKNMHLLDKEAPRCWMETPIQQRTSYTTNYKNFVKGNESE